MKSILLFLVSLALIGGAGAARPNMVFILSDDQRFDAMGCAGHPFIVTPTMDQLAKDGVHFQNAFVTTAICAASRASILTGMVERSHKYTFGTPPIAREHTNLSYPGILKRSGYRTGFVGKFGVGIEKGAREELFDFFEPLGRNPYFKKQPDGSLRHVSEITGDRAIEFLQECRPDQPFCLSVSFNAPHAEDRDKVNHFPSPLAVSDLYKDRQMPQPRLAEASVFNAQPSFLRDSMNRHRWFWRWDTPEKYDRNLRDYYRMISGIDGVMGRVLKALDTLGLAENTVVVFMGDNGYYQGNRGFAGKWSHYEDSLRVPMIIKDPRVPAEKRGRKETAMALNLDVAATLLDLADLEAPANYQGQSLLPYVRGERPAKWRKDFFCEHLFDNKDIPKYEGVRGDRWVYARYFQQDPPFEFLHDLEADPDQLRNLAGEPAHAEALKKMRQRCNDLRDSYGGIYSYEKIPTNRWLKARKAAERASSN
ncbi:MAG: sulfatase [Verrucomicrobiota bacterium]